MRNMDKGSTDTAFIRAFCRTVMVMIIVRDTAVDGHDCGQRHGHSVSDTDKNLKMIVAAPVSHLLMFYCLYTVNAPRAAAIGSGSESGTLTAVM